MTLVCDEQVQLKVTLIILNQNMKIMLVSLLKTSMLLFLVIPTLLEMHFGQEYKNFLIQP